MSIALNLSRRRALALAAAAAMPGTLFADDKTPIVIRGPKRTIGVGAIDVIGPYANPSATNAGGPIAAMLTTRLEQSGCCKVVERDVMAQLITEMDMAKSHVSNGTSAPMPGNILPAQFLVAGSVTAQSTADQGGGLSIGSGATSLNFGRSGGDIELDLRLIDTRTSVVVAAFKVRHKMSTNTVGVATTVSGVSVGPNAFFNTPLGKATDAALADAVVQITRTLAAQPWRGQVVKYDSGTLWANAGGDGGVNVGDRFTVEHLGESLTDPATGEVLKENLVELGVVTITNVEPKIAWGTYQPSTPGDPARGDFLLMQPR